MLAGKLGVVFVGGGQDFIEGAVFVEAGQVDADELALFVKRLGAGKADGAKTDGARIDMPQGFIEFDCHTSSFQSAVGENCTPWGCRLGDWNGKIWLAGAVASARGRLAFGGQWFHLGP